MLVISSGAPKSGSTWLFNILSEITGFSAPPEEFLLDKENVNPEIEYDQLEALLQFIDNSRENYLIKNHFGHVAERDLILASPNVLVLDIQRNLKDAIVSAYYYRQNRFPDFDKSFQYFYWVEGRYFADLVMRHHETWAGGAKERIHVASYENLKQDFEAEVLRIGDFMGIDLAPEDLARIKKNTSMENLRQKYQDTGEKKFFRKGEMGDWENHFRGVMLRDINAIESRRLSGLTFYQKNRGRVLKRWFEFFHGSL